MDEQRSTATIGDDTVEYHFGRGGHYLMSSNTVERLKALVTAGEQPRVGGLRMSLGTPVYADTCPCQNGSTPL